MIFPSPQSSSGQRGRSQLTPDENTVHLTISKYIMCCDKRPATIVPWQNVGVINPGSGDDDLLRLALGNSADLCQDRTYSHTLPIEPVNSSPAVAACSNLLKNLVIYST